MSNPKGAFSATCPTRILLDQLGDKWSVLTLTALARQPMRFNPLKRKIEGVSQKMLTQTLRRLEMNGLISRQAFPTVPVTVEYRITPMGCSLVPLLEAIQGWAAVNIRAVEDAREQYRALHDD